ncbi:MAG: glycosyltransferase [Gemmatimonadota bacterium]|nr:glycosyltransferase [Gemmatimonadota bacterium]
MSESTRPLRHVALFCHSLDRRAIARLCSTLCAEIAARIPRVSLVVVKRDPEASDPAGTDVVVLGAAIDRSAFAVPRLAGWLRRERPDVVFSQHNGPNRAAVTARELARVGTGIVTVEQNHYSTYVSPKGGRYSHLRIRDMATGWLYPRADRVAGVCPDVVEDLEERFPGVRGRTTVLPNPGPDPAGLERRLEGDPAHPWFDRTDGNAARVICSVANVIPRKGQDVLIEALPRIRRRCGEVRLLLVGRLDNAEYVDSLRARADELAVRECVSFAGYRDDPLPIVAASDVFALASRNEGMPLVLLEALACATPVVATACHSGPAYILEEGRAGRLVELDDPVAMAEAIGDVLEDPSLRRRLVRRGSERTRRFVPSRVASDYLEVAQEVRAATSTV